MEVINRCSEGALPPTLSIPYTWRYYFCRTSHMLVSALQVLWKAPQAFFMKLSHCIKHCGVPLPEKWKINANCNMLRPTFHPSGVPGLGTEHSLHSLQGHSFLVVSESRDGRNQTIKSSQHRQISSSFVMISATRSALPGFVCSSRRHSPGRAATSTYKMSNCVWATYTHFSKGKQNNTILGAEMHSVCCIIHQPPPAFVKQWYFCFFHFFW